ncbi:TraR/DksA C4-type zinc finger protein, partial [Helicobacter cinaedi]|uniref:TraR/DksA C4-type zinc finger protein n=1 Tax=Helicobacter cinaedi TaxID=213 RepID=UPI001A9D589E
LYHNEMRDIRNSLQKLKDGIFGICEMCDDEIDVERFKVKPHAKYCINCRELYEKSQKKER